MFPTFANPQWLWCLFLLPPLIGLRVWSHWVANRGVKGLVSPRLTGDLILGGRQWSRWIVFSLQWLALACLLLALARPQFGYEISETESESRNVIIAIDTSRSMLANDLTPDRLTRAKLAAQDIIQALPEDRIGLIAFAGKAFLQAPLTLDHDAVIESIQQFDSELIPRGGSNLTEAAVLAVETFKKAGSEESALVIFSDGEALEGREELDGIVEDAKSVGLMVVSIGVGTSNGSIIPEPDDQGKPQPGVFVTDDSGQVVRSRLDPAALQELSRTIGGGVYLDLGATQSVSESVPEALNQIEATRGVSEARRRPIERFIWPLSAALILIVAAWFLPGTTRLLKRLLAREKTEAEIAAPYASAVKRKTPNKSGRKKAPPAAVGLLIAGWLLIHGGAPSAQAGIGEVESPAFDAYRNRDFKKAIESYRQEIEAAEPGRDRAWLNLGLGSAAFKSGDLALAKEAFGRTLAEGDKSISTRAHYNLANTLFRTGEETLNANPHPKVPTIPKDEATKEAISRQWEAAREHYEAALAIDPANRDARHNLEVVDQRMQLLNAAPPEEEKKEDEEKDDQEKEDQKQPDSQNQEQQNSPQDSQSDPNPGDQPPPQDPQDQKPDEPKDPSEEQGKPDQPNDPSEQPGQPDQPKEQQPQQPPPPPEPTPEGELKGKPEQPKEQEAQPMTPQEAQTNPETGFSPEEARQMLRALADEDADVRPPIQMPMQAEKYKNW